MCEGVHGTCISWRSTLGVFCNHFPPYIWDKISPIQLEWLASKLQGSSCLCLPSAGVVTQPSSLCGAGNQNSGLPDCTASTLLTTIFLDPIIIFHKEINCPFGYISIWQNAKNPSCMGLCTGTMVHGFKVKPKSESQLSYFTYTN